MAKMKVRTGDNVLVISGKDKGKVSVVTSTSPKEGTVRVQDVAVQTKHVKARRANEKSEIRKIEGAIDASNIMIVCPACNKATRVAHKVIDGKNTRVCKKCGASLDVAKKVVKQTKETKASANLNKKSATNTTKKSNVKKQSAKSSTARTVARGDKA